MIWSKQFGSSKGSISPHKIKTGDPLVIEIRESSHIFIST